MTSVFCFTLNGDITAWPSGQGPQTTSVWYMGSFWEYLQLPCDLIGFQRRYSGDFNSIDGITDVW